MIASLRGILQTVGSDYLIVETAGIGFLVYVPRPLVKTVGAIGDELFLYTMLIVREDSMTLYGFATPEQRSTFETLLSVSGVGPRVAINLLSAATPDEIRLAVAQKDALRLSRVPGIGKKMAERLLLELKNKFDLKGLPAASGEASSEALASYHELLDLLISLGYSHAEAQQAIASLPADAPADLEERLRLALRYFGSI